MLDRTADATETAAEGQAPGNETARASGKRNLIVRLLQAVAQRVILAGAALAASAGRFVDGVIGAWHIFMTEGISGVLRRLWQGFVTLSFSSLTRRIVFINVAGLAAFVIGILFLSQFRAGLIDARVQSLLVQGEIIAGAIAASATVETDTITIDPDRLMDLQAGESYGPPDDALFGLEFPINPERVAPVLRRLISPTNTRARIYDRDGTLILDSRNLYGRGDVLRFDLPPPQVETPKLLRAHLHAVPPLARPPRSAALSRTRPRERQGLSRSGAGAQRPEGQRRLDRRPRRGHRFGRGSGAALPHRARRAAAVDARRRHRPGRRPPNGSRS